MGARRRARYPQGRVFELDPAATEPDLDDALEDARQLFVPVRARQDARQLRQEDSIGRARWRRANVLLPLLEHARVALLRALRERLHALRDVLDALVDVVAPL